MFLRGEKSLRRSSWLVAVALVLALVAGACGSNRSDDDTSSASGGGSSSETTTAPATSTKFGDLASPCGKGDAKGATDKGVTDTEITIGYGDDAGYTASPGLSHETSDAMKAFMKWCNDQGGINGRQIVGKYYDAKITDVSNAATQACADGVFMLVGQAWALDNAQEEIRLGCDLPSVPTYSVTADFAHAPLMYVSVPNPVDVISAEFAAGMAKLFPDDIKKASVVFGNFAATRDTKDKYEAAYSKFGFQFSCDQEYNILGEADWKPIAQKLKECGTKVVIYSGQAYPNGQNLLDAAAQVGFKAVWMWDANNYLDTFAKWNTNGNGDRNYFRTVYAPFEQADINPATKQYIDIVKADGGDISQLGEQTASSFLLWATAVKACGSNVTRQCVLDELKNTHEWTGGGLHVATDPGANMPPTCGMILKMTGQKYEQAYPAKKGEFDCSPSYAVKISGPVVDAAKLDANRITTLHRKG